MKSDDHEKSQDRLYHDPDLVQFYDVENGLEPDWMYCAAMAEGAGSVLDLGCGTGGFLTYLKSDKELCGVDPAAAMLSVARTRPGGEKLDWVQADARTVRLQRKFGLVVLTGHAFQVFLTDGDQRAVLATIASHLAPNGQFVFDTRNPLIEDWRSWTPDKTQREIDHPDLGPVTCWNDVQQDARSGVVTYESHYRAEASGDVLSAASKIAFPAQNQLAPMLEEAGLDVDRWLGDWDGSSFSDASEDIIPVGRLKR